MSAAPPLTARIDALAQRRLGGPATDLARLTGGASQQLWRVTVDGRRYVLRRLPDDDRIDRGGTVRLDDEAAVIVAAARHGVPVAPVVHVLDEADALGEGFVAEWRDGEALGRRVVGDVALTGAREGLAAACGTILAGIHAIPLADLPPLPEERAGDAIARLTAKQARARDPRPMFEAALAWLRAHLPDETPLALVHGDFRTGNFLVTPDGIGAVLDWEGCTLGDPMADLGWLCMPVWRFGRIDRPVGGFGTRVDLYAAYEALVGKPIDESRVRFWEIFGMLRWGLTCVAMAEAVAQGERSLERAAVGRRACEAELELLHALAGLGAPHA